MASASLPVLSAEGGLSRYLDEIRKFPMLEPNQEFMLAKILRSLGEERTPGWRAHSVAAA